jgi:hypothetical protein
VDSIHDRSTGVTGPKAPMKARTKRRASRYRAEVIFSNLTNVIVDGRTYSIGR